MEPAPRQVLRARRSIMLQSRFITLWLLWAVLYTALAAGGPNGLVPVPVWPVVSQHVLQARAWLGHDIVAPRDRDEKSVRIVVDPRLDVTPYFEHRVVRDPREQALLSNLAVAVMTDDGALVPAHTRWGQSGERPRAEELLCFVGFPPGPAFLLFAFVALLGSFVSSQWLSALLGGLAVAMLDALLPRWNALLAGDPLGRSRGLLTVLAGAGTLWLWIVPDGGTFLFAQTVGVTALTAALLLAVVGRPLLAGVAFGLAITSRPAMLLALPILVALILLRDDERPLTVTSGHCLRHLLRLFLGPAAFGGLALLLNYLRFASPWDFGYRFMLVPPFLRERLLEHGQLSWSYLGDNLRAVILQPPLAIHDAAGRWAFPWFASDPHGMGIFFVTPAFLALGAALWVRGRRPTVLLAAAWSSLILCCLPGLLYYNSGWVQWGGRFLLDAWPLWLLLAAVGLLRLPRWLAYGLVALSLISNLWAALLSALRIWPACCP